MTDRIEALLARKREIDMLPKGSFTARQRWLLEAVELLLEMALDEKSQKKSQKSK